MMDAARNGYKDIVAMLIDGGGNVDIQDAVRVLPQSSSMIYYLP
jgi:hypothetical protein